MSVRFSLASLSQEAGRMRAHSNLIETNEMRGQAGKVEIGEDSELCGQC